MPENNPPIGNVAISGLAFEGEALTSEVGGIMDSDGLGTFTYEWLRSGEVISGASNKTYVLSSADIGFRVSSRLSYIDGTGWPEILASAATEIVSYTNRSSSGMFLPVGGEVLVNTNTRSSQGDPSIASLSDGSFVVTWTSVDQDGSGTGIYGQHYDSAGARIGGEFQVNTHTLNDQKAPSVTSLSNGGFVVAWTSSGQDGHGLGVYGQRYTASGASVGDEFQINTATLNDQSSPSITDLIDGGFIVTWLSNGTSDSTFNILGQRYEDSGVRVGGEFQINSETSSVQTDPSLAPLADGGFLVSWRFHLVDEDTGGIYGQRYDVSGTKIGGEIEIAATTYVEGYYTTWAYNRDPSVASLPDGGFVAIWSRQGNVLTGSYLDGQRYNENGQKVGAPFVVHSYEELAGSGVGSSVTTLSDGSFVVVWTANEADSYGIYGQRFTAEAERSGAAFKINTEETGTPGAPTVAALSDGGFVVTWHSADQDGSGYGVYSQTFEANRGATGNVSINGVAFLDQTLNAEHIESIADADGLGGFTYEWLRSGAVISGATATTYTLRNADVGSDISFRVSYIDGFGILETLTSAPTEVVSSTERSSSSGYNPVGGEMLVNTHTAGDPFDINSVSDQSMPSATPLSDGGYVITWQSQGQDGDGLGIYGQRYDATGTTLGDEFQINTYVAGEQRQPSVTNMSDGGFLVAWKAIAVDYPYLSGVYGQRYSASGESVGLEFHVLGTEREQIWNLSFQEAITLSDGVFLIAYGSSGDLGEPTGAYAQRYDISGATIGTAFGIIGSSSNTSIAPLSDGGFVVISQSYDYRGQDIDVYGQRYSAEGASIGAGFQVNTYTAGVQGSPSVASLADGGFVVTWSSSGQDGSGTGVFGQLFDAAAVRVRAEFKINTYTTSNQSSPSVASTADGGFVVSWSSSNQDGSGLGIFAQRFSAVGTRVGDEFQINAYTRDHQYASSVISLSDGSIVATWQSADQDGSGYGIYSQRFEANSISTGTVDITGAPEEGATLTAVSTIADADGIDATSMAYQWLRGPDDIAGATSATYVLGQADVGAAISVRVSYTDGGGVLETVTSTVTAQITNLNDAPTGTVDITGAPEEGATLTAVSTVADADGIDATSMAYQWLRGPDDIAGATSATYVLGQADVGAAISVRVSYTDGGGVLETVTSTVTAGVLSVNKTIIGTADADQLSGGTGNDMIAGREGNDTVLGYYGNDTIRGEEGDDSIDGGDGDDYVTGDTGNDTLYLGAGNDIGGGGVGNDLIYGGLGANAIWGGLGNDTVQGGVGNDSIYGGGDGTNQLFGHEGNDLIYTGAGGDFVGGGAGNDVIRGGMGADTIYGGIGDNNVGGGDGDDILRMANGNDTIYGGLGNDNIGAGAGNDLIIDGVGHNAIWGGLGSDTVHGGSGQDSIYGGGGGANVLLGNGGNDMIFGDIGNDFIGGGADNDELYGGGGADTIYAGTGDDLIGGGSGNDVIYGSSGANWVYMGAGDDIFVAGYGKDVVASGPGADVFVFQSAAEIGIGTGRDVIADFVTGVDKIDFSNLNTQFNGLSGILGEGISSFYYFAFGGLLIGDIDGNGSVDWVLELRGVPALLPTDFIL